MRILLIKTSSMGDIIHTLPALTDAGLAHPNISFDWVIEESFAEIPTWHPLVTNIIPVALRQWRKNMAAKSTRVAFQAFRERLHAEHYDLVLDAQGLVKSAFLTLFAHGLRGGLDFSSARESLSSFAYQKKYNVNFKQHAIRRMRQLFSQALHYPYPERAPDFGIDRRNLIATEINEKYIVFLHGTTWTAKQWPEAYWMHLAGLVKTAGYKIKISGGSDDEVERARRISEKHPEAIAFLPRLSIGEMAKLLSQAKGAVAVDTGFGHLAAALNIPTVSLYGATNPDFTGAEGGASLHLQADFECAPCLARTCRYRKPTLVSPACFAEMTPKRVWSALEQQILVGQP